MRVFRLNAEGEIVEDKPFKESNFANCRFTIMVPEHYREDGSCLCNNKEHRKHMIAKLGYSQRDFAGIPLVD